MSLQPTTSSAPTTVGALPAPARELLAAVLAALDIPHPATAGDEVYERVLSDRISHTVVVLRNLLDEKPLMGIEWTTAYLRDRLAEHSPVGYVTCEQAHAALAEGKSWSEAVTLPAGEDR